MTKDRGRQEGCSPFDLNIFFSPSSRSLNGDLNKDSKINIENRGENSVSCHSSKHQTERRGTSQSIKMITNHSSSNSATPRSDPPHPPDHLEDPNCAISKSGNKIRISEKIARCPDKHHQGNRNGHQSRFNDKEVPGEKLAAGKLLINNREKMLESEGAEDSSMISQNLRRNTSSGPSFRSENLHDSSELTPRSSKSQRHPPASTILFDMPDPADPSKMSPKGTVQDQLETSQGLMETILGKLAYYKPDFIYVRCCRCSKR